MSTSDRALLGRSAGGDGAAFDTFVKRHQAAVYRYLRTLTPDAADAEDALQDAFPAAWRAAGTFRGDADARAWILTIARNALRREYRRRAGEPGEFVSLDELGERAGWGDDEAPDALLARLEERQLVQRALHRLSAADRKVLMLRDGEGCSGDEVAILIGLTVPAMKSRLHRARLRLTTALKEQVHAGA